MKGISEQCSNVAEGVEIIADVVGELQYHPLRWELLNPRHYANTPGYFNPRLNGGFMAIYMDYMFHQNPNKVEIDCILSTWEIINNLCPTFYIGQEFAEALTYTTPPENMVMKDLEWPFTGMVFCLPESFQMRYFRKLVPFIRVARVDTTVRPPPPKIQQAWKTFRNFGMNDDAYGPIGIIITAVVMENGRPVDYSGSFPETYSLAQMLTNDNYQVYFEDDERAKRVQDLEGTEQDDMLLLKKVISLVGHILLAMNAVPEQIEPPTVVFPVREKIQKQTPKHKWTWQPHFLGRKYRWDREKVSQGGTHASPRLHPRVGHWRHQLIGPRHEDRSLRQHKVIWIRPTLVNAKPERTDNAKTK